MTITSPLGPDALIVTHLSAHEAISQPFTYELDVVSQNGVVDPDKILNQPVCVTLKAGQTTLRQFHGIVQSIATHGATRGQDDADHYLYHLTVVPRLWFLNQTVDCRVYQKKSMADIVKGIFQDAGLTEYSIQASGGASPREYTVQYNESDLTFIQRLMEEEGCYYFFEHTAAGHKVIVADSNQSFPTLPEVVLKLQGADADGDLIEGWSRWSHTARGKFKAKDYDPTKPNTLLQDEVPTTLKTGGASLRDDFHWPAKSFEVDGVKKHSKHEMEASEANASLFEGTSHIGKMVAGSKFKITSRPATSYDDTYVLRSVTHTITDESWMTNDGVVLYENHFTCFPAKTTFRLHASTPRPRLDGLHSALVLGPSTGTGAALKYTSGTDEIYSDDLARVKIRFFWDHRGEATGGGAIWARVIQPWAGPGFGGQFIPRVGTEVAVAFIDGDPDRPIVVGGLYNGRDAPIYPKDEHTKSGFRFKSYASDKPAYNELTFDDKQGDELIYVYATKNLTSVVQEERSVTVKDGKNAVKVEKGDNTLDVDTGKNAVKVAKGDNTLDVDTGNNTVKVGTGNMTIKVDSGKVEIEAMQSIKLTVGGSTLELTPSGIKISGTMVEVSGSATAKLTGGMATVEASGVMTVKGSLVKIN